MIVRRTARLVVRSFLSTAGLALALAPSAQAYKLYETEGAAPQPLRWWRTSLNFSLAQVSPQEFQLTELQALAEASFGPWFQVGCEATASVEGAVPPTTFGGTSDATRATSPASAAVEPDNVIVFIQSASQWTQSGNSPQWIAITKIAHDPTTGEIVDADIEVNDGGYKFSIDEAPAAGEVDFLSMLIHEVGHFYGLDHSTDSTATMFATYSQGGSPTEARSLASDDLEGICALYTDVPIRPTGGGGGDDEGCMGGGLGFGLLGLAPLFLRRRR